jgi:diguanylate cyclase (GGDEF)-like protein/PAS domain S-box-containing protein
MFDSEQLHETLFALKRENEHLRIEAEHTTLLLQALESLLFIEQEGDPFSAMFAALRGVFAFDRALVFAQGNDDHLECIAATSPTLIGSAWVAGAFFNRVMDGRVSTMFSNREIEEWHNHPPGILPDQPALYLPMGVRHQRGMVVLLRGEGERGFDRKDVALARKFTLLAAHAFVAREASQLEAELLNKKQAEIQSMRFNAAINNMSHALVMFDAAARLVVWNDSYLELYGLPRQSVRAGITIHDKLRQLAEIGCGPEDYEVYAANLLSTVAEGRTLETTRQTKDGRTIRIVNRPMADGGWVGVHEDITERRRAEQKVVQMARRDALTGLANRAAFVEKLSYACWRHRELGEAFNVFILDLDRFKQVNDTLGHPAGDALLQQVAARLRSALDKTDVLARHGGDEFAIIQNGGADPRDAAQSLATRIIDLIKQPFSVDGNFVTIGTSIGIAMAPEHGDNVEQLVKFSDVALYRSKARGRNNYTFFERAFSEELTARNALENDLRQAVAQNELVLHFQPIVDTKTRKVCSAEALVRWRHPQRGLVMPDQFIPLAEETGLINEIGDWVLQAACTEAASWPSSIKVAVNLSGVQLERPCLVDIVMCVLADTGLAPERLELEITETVLIEYEGDCLSKLRQLRALGISVALDDFGTGYSSLSQLTMFPFNKIKIDKSFTQNMTKRADCAAIISSVLALAHSLEIATTAEGVEKQEQLQLLGMAGVTSVQGYFFSRPGPASELEFDVTLEGREVVGAA